MTTAARPKRRRVAKWQDADEIRWAIREWSARIGVKVPAIHFRSMSTKWASMSTARRMTVNTELLSLPKDLGEFVIVHELVHLLAPNHGRVFKAFMHAYLPDWEVRDQRLRLAAARTRREARRGRDQVR